MENDFYTCKTSCRYVCFEYSQEVLRIRSTPHCELFNQGVSLALIATPWHMKYDNMVIKRMLNRQNDFQITYKKVWEVILFSVTAECIFSEETK